MAIIQVFRLVPGYFQERVGFPGKGLYPVRVYSEDQEVKDGTNRPGRKIFYRYFLYLYIRIGMKLRDGIKIVPDVTDTGPGLCAILQVVTFVYGFYLEGPVSCIGTDRLMDDLPDVIDRFAQPDVPALDADEISNF